MLVIVHQRATFAARDEDSMRLILFSAHESVHSPAADKGYTALFYRLSYGDLALRAPLTTTASSLRGGLFMPVQG